MAETADATLGYGGEFHLHNGSILYQLVQVKEFDVPGPAPREQVESTHLQSPDWRREYLSGFYEDQDIEILLNSRPLSDTDTLLEAALAASDTRAFMAVLPENGEPVAQIEGTCRIIGYNRGRVTPDGVLEATATARIVTVDAIEAYAGS
jgi:hypothetical protein